MRLLFALAILGGCTETNTRDDSGDTAGACAAIEAADDTCTFGDDSSCSALLHQVDCCGTFVALGVAATEGDRVDALEPACRASYPGCLCPAAQTVTDSGEVVVDFASVRVGCISVATTMQCLTFVNERPPDGRCAAPDTPIATPDGERPIADLEVGDLVFSVDQDAVVAVPIARVSRTPVADHHVLRVALASGVVLEISAGHPTADGRSFGELARGEALDGEPIVELDDVPYAHPFTYDILPASDTGTYFAGGARIGSTLR